MAKRPVRGHRHDNSDYDLPRIRTPGSSKIDRAVGDIAIERSEASAVSRHICSWGAIRTSSFVNMVLLWLLYDYVLAASNEIDRDKLDTTQSPRPTSSSTLLLRESSDDIRSSIPRARPAYPSGLSEAHGLQGRLCSLTHRRGLLLPGIPMHGSWRSSIATKKEETCWRVESSFVAPTLISESRN
jgi:hypothetical protein